MAGDALVLSRMGLCTPRPTPLPVPQPDAEAEGGPWCGPSTPWSCPELA